MEEKERPNSFHKGFQPSLPEMGFLLLWNVIMRFLPGVWGKPGRHKETKKHPSKFEVRKDFLTRAQKAQIVKIKGNFDYIIIILFVY